MPVRPLLSLALTVLALCAIAPAAWALRTFPENSYQARIREVDGDTIVANRRTLHLSPGVIVFTPTNSTLVKSAIPVGAFVRVQLDMNGDVRRIWVLADDEIVYKPWWLFWTTDDIKDQQNGIVPADQ